LVFFESSILPLFSSSSLPSISRQKSQSSVLFFPTFRLLLDSFALVSCPTLGLLLSPSHFGTNQRSIPFPSTFFSLCRFSPPSASPTWKPGFFRSAPRDELQRSISFLRLLFFSSLSFLSLLPSTSFSSESSSFEARFLFSRRRITDSHGILSPLRSSPSDRALWEFRVPSLALPFSVSGVSMLRLLLLLQV
jgi:hypothetical protein